MNLTNPENIRHLTNQWIGPRDPNGRPLVEDDILQRMEAVPRRKPGEFSKPTDIIIASLLTGKYYTHIKYWSEER